jgi:hypothetical protein
MPLACLGSGRSQFCSIRTLEDPSHRKETGLPGYAVGRDNTYRILGKRSEPTDVTRVISKELNFSAFGPFRIRSIALRTIFCPSITEDSLFNFSGQAEEGPSGFVDLSIQSVPVEIFD